ncbi:hypothetical protein SISSUDRAFT_19885 [Sistotremastrum suecicum HHB10207 ss-3]|uniref:Histone deacetylase interacting domain-containing protein n=1 Tax=Sistotremastrum suecicum HHB10207 ss-3 TaxID=1314776 RepID=A0A166J7N4_9AGAM|nr:hypothetical protein SISSUDRAFT_19885 [Sistotremastrum suecicum HHB10207 ss-3]
MHFIIILFAFTVLFPVVLDVPVNLMIAGVAVHPTPLRERPTDDSESIMSPPSAVPISEAKSETTTTDDAMDITTPFVKPNNLPNESTSAMNVDPPAISRDHASFNAILERAESSSSLKHQSATSDPKPTTRRSPASPAIHPLTPPPTTGVAVTQANDAQAVHQVPTARQDEQPPPPAPDVAPSPRPNSAPMAPGEPGRQLDVSDALSYLDLVKIQFEQQPAVYNKFLDVMKDFKSEDIDTPGVISRVSELFAGHPTLIQGFNTFLPDGYRIECSTDPKDPNLIVVTTPSGVSRQTTTVARAASPLPPPPVRQASVLHPGVPPPSATAQQSLPSFQAVSSGLGMPSPGLPAVPFIGNVVAPVPRPSTTPVAPPLFQNPLSPAVHTDAAHVLGGMHRRVPSDPNAGRIPQQTQPPSTPVASTSQTPQLQQIAPQPPIPPPTTNADPASGTEFHHAMQYINKIKNTYQDNPDVYKGFLQLLQSYQKDQMSIQEAYNAVSILFKNAPELLEEFKVFLPESAGGIVGPLSEMGGLGTPGTEQWAGFGSGTQEYGGRRKVEASTTKRKKKAPEKDTVGAARGSTSRVKKAKHSHNAGKESSPAYAPQSLPTSPPRLAAATASQQPPPPVYTGNPEDDATFFDNVKRTLEDRDAYDEFLKVLHLYTREIIDTKTLVERSQPFLRADLMEQFKDILAWDDNRDGEEEDNAGPEIPLILGGAIITERGPRNEASMRCGPSYRRLPLTETTLACSGRDELGRSVLNDHWVSHPTWASEDSGFVTHRKNIYEEALHRSEEERHEYQFHIEAMAKTISLLEPLRQKIEEMNAEERTAFRLPPSLGAASPSIHQRIIKKVWGKEAGLEIIQSLHSCPGVAIPVVVARLRQKDDEWRRAQREWNKTWRDVGVKNYYRSLDHQGITFKANDKKAITTKAFVGHIEGLREQHSSPESSSNGKTSETYPLEYAFEDDKVLQDTLKLSFSYLDRQVTVYSSAERHAIEKFLRQFVPLLLMRDPREFDAAFGTPIQSEEEDGESEIEGLMSRADDDDPKTHKHSSKRVSSVLRKKLTKMARDRERSAAAQRATKGSSANSQIPSPLTPDDGAVSPGSTRHRWRGLPTKGRLEEVWIRQIENADDAAPKSIPGGTGKPRAGYFYTNTTFYTLIRLLQLVYSRLLACKESSAQQAKDKKRRWQANAVAVELGANDTMYYATAPYAGIPADGEPSETHYYDFLLESMEKLMDGEIDQALFEDCMRVTFGTQAYTIFTLDKVIGALIKQVSCFVEDDETLCMLQEC